MLRPRAGDSAAALAVACLLGLPVPAGAQESQRAAPAEVEGSASDAPHPAAFEHVTLADAVARLIAANPDVRAARVRVEQARIALDAALAPLDTVLGAELRASRAAQPTDEGLSSGRSLAEGLDLGLRAARVFPAGTRVQLSFGLGRSRSEFPISSSFLSDTIVRGPNYSTSLSATATQPLLRGRGRSVQLLPQTLARLDGTAADAAVYAAAGSALAALLEHAVDLRLARREEAARAEALRRAEVHLAAALAEVEAGRVAAIEVDLVRLRIVSLQEALLVAAAATREHAASIRALWGERAPAPLEVQLPGLVGLDPTDAGLCAAAAEASPAIRELDAALASARARLVAPADALRSQLDLGAGITVSGLDERLDTSLGQTFTARATTIFALLSWQLPVPGRGARGDLERAELDVEALAQERERAIFELCGQIDVNARSFSVLVGRAALAEQREDIARRGADAEAARFAQGYSTVQAGLDAVQQLEDAAIERARIARDLDRARITAGLLSGSLQAAMLGGAAVE